MEFKPDNLPGAARIEQTYEHIPHNNNGRKFQFKLKNMGSKAPKSNDQAAVLELRSRHNVTTEDWAECFMRSESSSRLVVSQYIGNP